MRSRALFLDHVGALGGAELALIDVAKAYRNTSTFLLFSEGPFRKRLAAEGVRVEVIEAGNALHSIRRETRWPGLRAATRVVSLAWRVAEIAREHDFIHANSQKAFVVACVAGLIARRPVIWDLNDLLSLEHFSRVNILLDVALANHLAVRVIANSRASAEALVAHGGRKDRVRVVYNGIDPAPFDAVPDAEIQAAWEELGLDPSTPVAGVFGRLADWKGQHIALEALAQCPGVHLLLVGDALFGERAYAERLRHQVRELGLTDRVHFLGFRSDVPRLMRLVQVVLHTSTAPEPFGRVIVEGMLAQKPVIATKAGGVAEIIDHGETGLLVSPGNVGELAAALRSVLGDPEYAGRLAAAGRAAAEARFTVDAMVNGMTQHMEEVARG
jgi:glycosyltransferase involved in cell wall biosynthesis